MALRLIPRAQVLLSSFLADACAPFVTQGSGKGCCCHCIAAVTLA